MKLSGNVSELSETDRSYAIQLLESLDADPVNTICEASKGDSKLEWCRRLFPKRTTKDLTIKGFNYENRFLSNFYRCHTSYNGRVFKSSEALFQSFKFKGYSSMIDEFSELDDPLQARRLGRSSKITTVGWDKSKLYYMLITVMAKFSSNYLLSGKLMSTQSYRLVENTRVDDTYWGVNSNDEGHNYLGIILEIVRYKLLLMNSEEYCKDLIDYSEVLKITDNNGVRVLKKLSRKEWYVAEGLGQSQDPMTPPLTISSTDLIRYLLSREYFTALDIDGKNVQSPVLVVGTLYDVCGAYVKYGVVLKGPSDDPDTSLKEGLRLGSCSIKEEGTTLVISYLSKYEEMLKPIIKSSTQDIGKFVITRSYEEDELNAIK